MSGTSLKAYLYKVMAVTFPASEQQAVLPGQCANVCETLAMPGVDGNDFHEASSWCMATLQDLQCRVMENITQSEHRLPVVMVTGETMKYKISIA